MRYFANYLLLFLPVSNFFRLKRIFLKWVGIVVSDGVNINGHTWFYGHGKVEIKENSWVGPRCSFYTGPSGDIFIGRNCDIAPEVAFVTGSHEVGEKDRRAGKGTCQPIIVENGCWIGTRVTILGGVRIGSGSIVAAGALVNKDVPRNSLVAGVPATTKKQLG